MEITELVERLERVERDNQRLKLVVGALMLVLAAVPLTGAVIPEQIPEVIRAQRFEAIDETGKGRAVMNTDGIIYFDQNRTPRARMTSYGFTYLGENEKGRAVLGSVNLYTPSTGGTTSSPAGVVLYDSELNVIWQAPPGR